MPRPIHLQANSEQGHLDALPLAPLGWEALASLLLIPPQSSPRYFKLLTVMSCVDSAKATCVVAVQDSAVPNAGQYCLG